MPLFEGNVSETCGWQGGTNLVCRLTVNRKKPRNVMRTKDNGAAAPRDLAVLGGISDRS